MPNRPNDNAKDPIERSVDTEIYDTWFRERVNAALMDKRSLRSHSEVMGEAQALIDRKRVANR